MGDRNNSIARGFVGSVIFIGRRGCNIHAGMAVLIGRWGCGALI
jgi:hypothetical protein